jgi:biopolymer transport protein TolQ
MHGQMNIWQILWDSGFVVKIVLVLLLAFSIVSWAIIIQKLKEFKAIQINNENFINAFKSTNSLQDGWEVSIRETDALYSIVFKKGFDELSKLNTKLALQKSSLGVYLKEHGLSSLERALKQGQAEVQEKLEFRISLLASIGSVAPFVGLFGTVWGIIDAFTGLSQGGGSIEAVAPGIAEALVATAIGLAAAIPATWFFNYFYQKISVFQNQLDSFGNDFLNLAERSFFIKGE